MSNFSGSAWSRMITIFLLSVSLFTCDALDTAVDYSSTDYDITFDHATSLDHPRRYDADPYSSEFLESPQYPSDEYDEPVWSCQCAMFLVTDSNWLPEHEVFTTGEQYPVNCSKPTQAEQDCRQACEDENSSVARVFRLHPESLHEYPPSRHVPCAVLPAATATFYRACGSSWIPLPLPSYSHVCCHPHTLEPMWCDAIPDEFFLEPELQSQDLGVEDRGLDLEKNPNDIENNEIEGSTKPDDVADDLLGGDVENQTWMKTILNYFGYNSLAEMVKGFDIFSLPQRFRHAVRVYRDEVGMGQCYMEYTTYSIFTKGENPFEAFVRSKRSLAGVETTNDAGRAGRELDVVPSRGEDYRNYKYSSGESKQAQIETIKSLVGSLVNMLDQSESTKRYAVVIKQLLPVVTRVYAAEDPQQAVHTLVSSVLGPYLEKLQIQNRRPKPGISNRITEKKDKLKYSKPSIPDPPSSSGEADVSEEEPSQISTILLNLVRQYMGIYFNTLPGATKKIVSTNTIEEEKEEEETVEEQKNEKPTVPPSKRPSRPSQFNWMRLLNLFLGGPGQARPRPPPTTAATTTPPPKIDEKKDEVEGAELVPTRDFVDVILEVIRPVFISILGKAPGDSGVASIREVSRLSVLGRVDATVAEEILSPYFCLKTYGVNKAWSLTERTLRNFAASLTPEEIETVRALLS